MSKKCAEELLEAQNEETSQERLAELWGTSRSVKVRKAVASNPNASPAVLKAAARLYLEEVVQNPGFEMLHLFDAGDTWIRDVADAYNDPDKFIMSQSIYYWSRGNVDSYLKACLLSKNLSAASLDRVLDNIPKTSLRRTIKNPEVRERIRYIVINDLKSISRWSFDLGSVITLYMEGIIDREELKQCLMNYSQGTTSARRRVYVGFIEKLQRDYVSSDTEQDKSLVVELLARLILISRSHTLNWVWSPLGSREECLKWSGELYSKVLRIITRTKTNRVLVNDNIRWVGNIVTYYIKARFFTEEDEGQNYSAERMEDAFRFVKSYGLENENFRKFGLTLHTSDRIQALANCSLEAKEFYVRSKCMGDWASITASDTRYAIVEEVNNSIYERNGISDKLIFDRCSIRKIVGFGETTHIY